MEPVTIGIVGPTKLVYGLLSMGFSFDTKKISARIHIGLRTIWRDSEYINFVLIG